MVLTADNNKRRQRSATTRISMITTGQKFICTQAVDDITVGKELHVCDDQTVKTISDVSVANPTQITCVGHGLVTGDQIVITNNDSTPALNGSHIVTRLTNDVFTVPVNVSADGTGEGRGLFTKGTPNLRTMLLRGQAAPATDV